MNLNDLLEMFPVLDSVLVWASLFLLGVIGFLPFLKKVVAKTPTTKDDKVVDTLDSVLTPLKPSLEEIRDAKSPGSK